MSIRFVVDRLKVKAASRSMHQFCANVRNIFPREVDNEVIETATVFLYVKIAREVFGRRFADRMSQMLRDNLKYVSIQQVNSRLARICKEASSYEQAFAEVHTSATTEERFHQHVSSVVRAMLLESQSITRDNEDDMLRKAFKPFDHTVRTMKSHLLGIKRQNHFIMRQ